MPLDGPGRQQVAAERPAEDASARRARPRAARRGRSPSRSPSRAPSRRDPRWRCCPVAPGGYRAAAELAERRLEAVDSRLERGQHVRQPLAARVMEVSGQLDRRAAPRRAAAKNSRTCSGLAIPVVSPKPISEAPAAARRARDREHALTRQRDPRTDSRTTPRSRPRSAGPRPRARANVRSRPASDSSIERPDVLLVVGLRRGQEAVDLLKALAMRSARSRPRSFGISTLTATESGSRAASSTCSASASCGITSARTKLVTSIRAQAGLAEQLDQAHLVGRRDHLGLVLKAVARPDLSDPDARGKSAHSPTTYR